MKRMIILLMVIMSVFLVSCDFSKKNTIIIKHTERETITPKPEKQPETEKPIEKTEKPKKTPKPTKKPKTKCVVGVQSKKERPGIYTVSWLKYKNANNYQTQICEHKNFKSGTSSHTLNETSIDIYTRSGRNTYIRIRAYINGHYTKWSDIYDVKTGKMIL